MRKDYDRNSARSIIRASHWHLDRKTTWPALSNREVASLSRIFNNWANTPEKGRNFLQSKFGQNYDNNSARNTLRSDRYWFGLPGLVVFETVPPTSPLVTGLRFTFSRK